MKPVSITHYNTLRTYITNYEHTYNAIYVVMVMVRIKVDPNLAYDHDYTAL